MSKANNMNGKFFLNHNLDSDEELGKILEPFGCSGFVTNFSKNSDSFIRSEPGRLFCSCGYRDNMFPLGRYDYRTEFKCPNCGKKIVFIHVPRYENKGSFPFEGFRSIVSPDNMSISLEAMYLRLSASEDNLTVIVDKTSNIVFKISRDGKFEELENNYNSILAVDALEDFVDFFDMKEIIMAFKNSGSTEYTDNYIGLKWNFPIGSLFLRFLIGFLNYPNIFNPEVFKEHTDAICRFMWNFGADKWDLSSDADISAIYKKLEISDIPNKQK